jgi:hypothetical protein
VIAPVVDAGAYAADQVEVTPDAAPIAVDAELVVDAPSAPALYSIADALADIAADPLKFVGTGAWFGNFSIHACAYRNTRVVVINVYCTVKEQPALGISVLSPTRGRLNIYAEGESAISQLARSKWFTFKLETDVPDEPVALDLTFPQLDAWEEHRYNARRGACWTDNGGGCSGGLEPGDWTESARDFLAQPPDAFYRLAKDLHARAVRDSQRTK